MALIEKIRNQGWLVLVMVGIGIVGYLIPYDAVMALFGKGSNNIGVIDGHVIGARQWQDALKKQSKLFQYTGNESALSNDTWNNLVENTLMADEYDALGLSVSETEYDEVVFGEILSPYVKNTIYQGRDSASYKENLRKNFESMEPEMAEGWRELIIMKRQREKFDMMVKSGLYANNLDGKWAFKQSNDFVAIDYVVKTYSEIPDSAVTVTDSDVRAYYNKHKKDREYEQKETTRSIEYIRFPVTPSATDSSVIRENLTALVGAFRTATDDSAFAVINAANPLTSKQQYKPGSMMEPYNTEIQNDSVGKVLGPLVDGTSMKLIKIGKRVSESDSVQARHILFKGANSKSQADSVKKVIEKNKNFAEMAAKFGTDGTKDKGGDLGMFARGAMVKPFEEAAFNGKVGELQIVETQFGTHIVEVTKKGAPKLVTYTYTIDKAIAPSATTIKSAYSLAGEFASNFSDSVSFRNAADTLRGGTVITPARNLRPNDQNVAGLSNAFQIVQWAYGAEIGDVSQPVKIDDQYVIALLTDIKERGTPTFENVKDRMREETIKEKKAEKYMEMMKNGSLEDIAKAVNSDVKKAEKLNLRASNIPGSNVAVQEPEVVGIAFGIQKDFVTAPIQGKGGVYVIRRASDLTEGQSQDGYLSDRSNTMNTMQARAAMSIFNSFREEGNVEDNRFER